METKQRPTSLTVIGWIFIVLGGLSAVATLFTYNSPEVQAIMEESPLSVATQYTMMIAGLAASIAAGIGILKGQNWARYLYVGWSLIGFAVTIATSPLTASMIPGLVLFLVFAIFLFRPQANEYFTQRSAFAGDQER
jgi:hypothetical protein